MTHVETIGERLARYRKASGMSAQRLADQIGSTRAVINNLELGRREDMTVGQLVQIARALGIPPVALAANIHDPLGPAQYGDMSNWEVVECLKGESVDGGDIDDIVFLTRILMGVVEGWGRHANAYLDRVEAAKKSGDERDVTIAGYERDALVRLLRRGKDAHARLEKFGVDVSWARGDWMNYEIPDHGFDQTTP